EHECFVLRFRVGGAVVKLDELMIQHPFAMHARLFNAAFSHLSLYSPIADKLIEERIAQLRRRTGSKYCTGRQKQRENGRSCKHRKPEFVNGFLFSSGNQRI